MPPTLHYLTEAAQERGFVASQLSLFPMPNVDDVTDHLLAQDVVWVFGGSVAGLLAMWRLHGVDIALHTAWQAGVVLTGISAGSICWHVGGTTDSFGPELRAPATAPAGLLYRGAEFVGAVAENDSAAAYFVTGTNDGVVESRLDTRRL